MFLFGVLVLMFLISIFLNFNKKLINLLMLESCMLILISDYFYSFFSGYYSVMICLILILFMVLDSVFGLSLLGNSTRFSSFSCPLRFSI